jgi:hypothetical protein
VAVDWPSAEVVWRQRYRYMRTVISSIWLGYVSAVLQQSPKGEQGVETLRGGERSIYTNTTAL